MTVEVLQNVNGAWYWNLVGANGECLATSEAYSSKTACKKTANLVGKALGMSKI